MNATGIAAECLFSSVSPPSVSCRSLVTYTLLALRAHGVFMLRTTITDPRATAVGPRLVGFHMAGVACSRTPPVLHFKGDCTGCLQHANAAAFACLRGRAACTRAQLALSFRVLVRAVRNMPVLCVKHFTSPHHLF